MNCLSCGKETNNPKFCSKSCATTFNNRLYPRRNKATKYCKHCGIPVTGRKTVCEGCNRNNSDWSQRTLGELQSIRRYQISSRIRALARYAYMKSSRPKICQNCGYDKHIEVCHIKAIDSFSMDTKISEINSMDNLVALCPNCHWEFDHDLLSLVSR